MTQLSDVMALVSRYYSGLEDTVQAVLSVFGSMALAGRTKPLSLILESPSGYGKTAALQMCFSTGPESELAKYVYRSDKFTPRSFVTHAANIAKRKLSQMDLLPKLAGKVLVTKELSPIFRGREQDLEESFSILISVLDGKGFTSDSGTRGKRGYETNILFNWCGASTPLPARTHRLMAALGTRLLFYELPALSPNEANLLEYARSNTAGKAEQVCQAAVEQFLIGFFDRLPVGSVPADEIEFSDDLLYQLVRWAQFLSLGRAQIQCEYRGREYEPVAALPAEAPYKIIGYLKELALGRALIHGRSRVNDSDMELVSHVAISSVPGHLRPLVQELRSRQRVYTPTACQLCRVSGVTARHYLQELSLLGIGRLQKGSARDNSPDYIILSNDLRWLNPTLLGKC